MSKLLLSLAIAALALLGACATSDPVTPAPAPVVVAPAPAVVAAPPPGTVVVQQPQAQVVVPATAPLRAGHGRIESITPLPTSAATGSGQVKQQRRIGIKMDDGTLQYVDTAAEGLSIGERVEITADGQIRH